MPPYQYWSQQFEVNANAKAASIYSNPFSALVYPNSLIPYQFACWLNEWLHLETIEPRPIFRTESRVLMSMTFHMVGAAFI